MSYLRPFALALVVVTAVVVGGGAIVAAQDGPGEPASFYGDAIDEDGTDVPTETTIVAVVDGDVAGEITVETAGEYGGSGAFDEKLSLDSAAGDNVSIHVGDAAGPEALEGPITLESGTTEQSLTFPAGAFDYEPSDPEPTLEAVELDLDATDLGTGESTDATVTAEFDDGTTETVTDEATLSSDDTDVASVDGTTVTGETAGTALLTAEHTVDGTTAVDELEVDVDSDSGSGSDPGEDPEDDPEEKPEPEPEYTLELLGEQHIDHAHACTHGDYDERTPLDAGNSADDGPVVDDDHIIWSVTYEGSEGYVTFDADGHWYDGPFVFYMADGSVDPVDATVLDSGGVPDCDTLDNYIEVETPDDGTIVLELTGGSSADDESLDPPTEEADDAAPNATIDVQPTDPVTDENVTFNATESDGGSAEIDAYEWNVSGENLTGKTVNTSFENASEKTIELTVENADGETDTANETINVSEPSVPVFELSSTEVPDDVTPNTTHTVTTTVANTGTGNGTATVTYEFDGEKHGERTIELEPDNETTLEFNHTAPADAGEYQHVFTTANDSMSENTTVDVADGLDRNATDDASDTDEGAIVDDSETEASETERAQADSDDATPGFGITATLGAILALVAGVGLRRWSTGAHHDTSN